ncbi:PAS domain S-box [Methanomethylovorans hollandica DSM 15978]|uniref:histidine kinase n=1 Tax=Methanomethylovorans hollandica (strain DSM 15978 / NBRC 107637 / DMS1) TaxID=867904 RepID=L0KZG6_METHD|nr:GAF domain-containing protein [Methanomethylovorans hollandica]AGB49493.1 PAS domain S-box [Methanomethylovorans hollandica DSM 15978]
MAQFDISAETLRLINESPMTIFVWRAEQGWPVEFVSENVRQFGYSPEDFLSGKIKYEDIIHPDDIEEIHIRFATCIKEGDSNFSHEYRVLTKSGDIRWVYERTIIRRDQNSNIQYYEGIILDISNRKLSEIIINCRNRVLESLASGASLDEVLTHLVKMSERAIPESIGFVMLLDKERKHLIRAISPLLPGFYKKAIESLPIEEGSSSCGTAAYTGKRIIVENIMEHPYWKDMKEFASQVGIKSSCCEPIMSSNNEVLGTFEIYFREPHIPTKEEIEILKANANLAAIAINHKIATDALCESEQKLKGIFNSINDQLYISELNGKLIYVNQVVVDTLGYSKEEILSTSPVDIVTSKYLQRMPELLKIIETKGRAIYETEAIIKDGTIIPLEINARFIVYNGKKMVLSVARDITERKKAERKSQLEEKRLDALVKLNGMVGSSLEEITDFAREEAVKLTESTLGYLAFMNADETELIMHSWSESAMKECGIKDKRFIYPIKTTGLWGEAVRQRKPIITNDYPAPNTMKKGYPEDHVKLIRHMNVPIFDGDHIIAVVGVGNKEEEYNDSDLRQLILLMQGMWSLIQRKQMEDALKKYSEELTKANKGLRSIRRMKTEFVAERMDLFEAEQTECSIMDDETIRVIDDQQAKSIDSVMLNSERLKRLVDSLLYMSLEQAGKIKYSFFPVHIDNLISEALMNLILLIDEKMIIVDTNIPKELSTVRADRDKLTETFINLIDNAVMFTPVGGRISIDLSEEKEHQHIRITDTGPGIQKDLIPHLFHKFYQMEDSMSRRYQGLESGLYISKNIILAHQGQIWIESEMGKGTTFHIKLPICKDNLC